LRITFYFFKQVNSCIWNDKISRKRGFKSVAGRGILLDNNLYIVAFYKKRMSLKKRIHCTLASKKSLHRTDFYKILTGQEKVPFGVATTRIDPWSHEAKVEDMDAIYSLVQLCEKRHGKHYSRDFQNIREVYKQEDFEEFIKSVNELLVSIIND
jgi:hypothetical protein